MPALQTSDPSLLARATAGATSDRGVVTCAPESSVAAVAATLASHAVHAAVILTPGSDRALVVCDLDLITAALAGEHDRAVQEIAREPMATIEPSAPLTDVVELMARRHVAYVLVAEPGTEGPTGVLSSLDIAAVLSGRDPALARMIRPGPARPLVAASTLSATTVGAVMHPSVITCPPRTPLDELAGTMADLRVHCVAVAGVGRSEHADEHLVWGLVSDMDIMHAAHRGELSRPASDVAATAPLALPETAALDRAAALMTSHDAGHVVAVGGHGLPSGVVSTLDVLRIVASG